MFICCQDQLKVFEKNSYNIINNNNVKFDSVMCLCNICDNKSICKYICNKCYKSLNKGKFQLCKKLYYSPINDSLNLEIKIKILKKIMNRYQIYDCFDKYLLPYMNDYTNFYNIIQQVKNGNKDKCIKDCFTPFFNFGILYFLEDKKKFLCNECINY